MFIVLPRPGAARLRGRLSSTLGVMKEGVATPQLTDHERRLALWMLEHGTVSAERYREQLACASATLWRCPCGCASFNFKVEGLDEAPPGVNILGDYLVGDGGHQFGIFNFESEGVLSGVEVYGLSSDAPPMLPEPEQLRPADFNCPGR